MVILLPVQWQTFRVWNCATNQSEADSGGGTLKFFLLEDNQSAQEWIWSKERRDPLLWGSKRLMKWQMVGVKHSFIAVKTCTWLQWAAEMREVQEGSRARQKGPLWYFIVCVLVVVYYTTSGRTYSSRPAECWLCHWRDPNKRATSRWEGKTFYPRKFKFVQQQAKFKGGSGT